MLSISAVLMLNTVPVLGLSYQMQLMLMLTHSRQNSLEVGIAQQAFG